MNLLAAASEPLGTETAALLAAIPLTARHVLLLGAFDPLLATRYRARNPKAVVEEAQGAAALRSGGNGGGHDAIVLESGAYLPDLLDAGITLAPQGALVARVAAADLDHYQRRLAGHGLVLLKGYQHEHGIIAVAVRAPAPEPRRLELEFWAYAPMLMDIRARLPLQFLMSEPRLAGRYCEPLFELPSRPRRAPKLVLLQRPGRYTEAELRSFLAEALAGGWLPVLEIDDHPEMMAKVTGRTADDLDWLFVRGTAAVQASTPRLAEALRAQAPEVQVFPNAVFELPAYVPQRPGRRVFYGAASRGPVAAEVAASLGGVVRQFPDLEFVVVGDRAFHDALPTARKSFHEYAPYDRYLELMRGCDVTLSPLAGRPFEDTKSDAKFLDAASCSTLMIASPLIYEDVVREDETGLIARRPGDWALLLARALGDDAKRARMTRKAWEYVREQRMFADQIALRRDWYLNLWVRREQLARALCERMPGLREDIRRVADAAAADRA